MATMNISLPITMREWVKQQVQTGSYANASDYMRDLIRHDQREREQLHLALLKGKLSGKSNRKIQQIITDTKQLLKNE